MKIWGTHAAMAVLHNPNRRVRKIWTVHAETLPKEWQKHPCVSIVSEQYFSEGVHQNICVEADALPRVSLNAWPKGAPVLVLDRVCDPQNVGGLFRLAAALGVWGVVRTERHSPDVSGALLKAASGGYEHTHDIRVPNLCHALDILKSKGAWVIGLAEEGQDTLDTLPSLESWAMVAGSEGEGLRDLTRKKCDFLVSLPTQPTFSTLNVVSSVAIGLYAMHHSGGNVQKS